MLSFWDYSRSAMIGAVARLLPVTLSVVLGLAVASGAAFSQPASVIKNLSSDHIGNLDDYIYFAGPEDMDKPEIRASAATLIPWSEADRINQCAWQ